MSKNTPLAEIKKIISQAKQDDPKVIQLDLSGIKFSRFTPEITQVLQQLKSLEVLCAVDCGLKSLQGFPNCKFVALDLSKNELNDESKIEQLAKYPDLTQVLLNENKIQKLQTVLKLEALSKLVEIDFENNPVSKVSNYRQTIFEKFPVIEIVDRKDKEGNVVPEDEDEAEFQDDGEDDSEEYNDEDEDDDQFDEDDFDDQQQSQPKKKKGGNPKKK